MLRGLFCLTQEDLERILGAPVAWSEWRYHENGGGLVHDSCTVPLSTATSDAVVIAGGAVLGEGCVLKEDVVVLGGTIGDHVQLSGSVTVKPGAVIGSRAIVWGGTVTGEIVATPPKYPTVWPNAWENWAAPNEYRTACESGSPAWWQAHIDDLAVKHNTPPDILAEAFAYYRDRASVMAAGPNPFET